METKTKKTETLLKHKPKHNPTYSNHFTPYAKELAKEVDLIKVNGRRPNTLLIGEAGTGKSVFLKALYDKTREQGDMPCNGFHRTNLHMAVDSSALVGERFPRIVNGNVDLPFVPNLVYKSVRDGSLLALEELNRAGEIMSRFFNLLDYATEFEVPEESRGTIEVHPNLWICATMNPTGGAYTTQVLDKALDQRFSVKIRIGDNEPLVDEEAMIFDLLGKDKAYAERMFAFSKTCREDGNGTKLSIREVANMCTHINSGVSLERAISFVVTNAYSEDQTESILSTARLKFRLVEEKLD